MCANQNYSHNTQIRKNNSNQTIHPKLNSITRHQPSTQTVEANKIKIIPTIFIKIAKKSFSFMPIPIINNIYISKHYHLLFFFNKNLFLSPFHWIRSILSRSSSCYKSLNFIFIAFVEQTKDFIKFYVFLLIFSVRSQICWATEQGEPWSFHVKWKLWPHFYIYFRFFCGRKHSSARCYKKWSFCLY